MGIVTIPSGVSTTSNTSNVDFDLVGIANDANVNTFKTLINGQWHSWLKGTPDIYQGFNSLQRGYGYVVKTNGVLDIDFGSTVLDVNNLVLSTGIMLLGIPFEGKQITNSGHLPRFSASSMKTIDVTWKSWTRGVPSNFQGFSSVETTKGYVVDIDKVFDNYLYKNKKDAGTGVKIGFIPPVSSNQSIIDTMYLVGPQCSIVDTTHTTPIVDSASKSSMYINVGGNTSLIQFPTEMIGSEVVVRLNDITINDNGDIIKTPTNTVLSPNITITPTTTNIGGSITAINKITSKDYIYVLEANTNNTTPTQTSYLVDEDILEIMYDTLTYDNTLPKKNMNIIVGGNKSRLSYATEYTGGNFIVILNGVSYTGTFTESVNYITLTAI